MNPQRTTLALCLGAVTVAIIAYIYFSMDKPPGARQAPSVTASGKLSGAALSDALKRLTAPTEKSMIPKDVEQKALRTLEN